MRFLRYKLQTRDKIFFSCSTDAVRRVRWFWFMFFMCVQKSKNGPPSAAESLGHLHCLLHHLCNLLILLLWCLHAYRKDTQQTPAPSQVTQSLSSIIIILRLTCKLAMTIYKIMNPPKSKAKQQQQPMSSEIH